MLRGASKHRFLLLKNFWPAPINSLVPKLYESHESYHTSGVVRTRLTVLLLLILCRGLPLLSIIIVRRMVTLAVRMLLFVRVS